jgi:uncharacterized SAM-binding protein YcdF (DUF218 family)
MLVLTALSELVLPTTTYLVLLLGALCLWGWVGSNSGARRLRGLSLALCLWAWVFSTPAVANLLVRQLEGLPSVESDAAPLRDDRSLVVVLASGEVWSRAGRLETRLDASGWERIRAAVKLWGRTGGRLLVAGGPGGEVADANSFAALMADVAQEMGVPRDSIVLGSGSARTYEDLSFAAGTIRAAQGPVWLVTSAMHMPRSLAVARQLALPLIAFRCDYRQNESPTWKAWLPNNGGPQLFAAALHEVFGLAYYRWRGWAQ